MSFKQRPRLFHYKIFHRLLNVNEYLFKCNLENSDLCPFCPGKESIVHALCDCPFNNNFIQKCTEWLDKLTKTNFAINNTEFIFGIINENYDKHINLYNRFYFLVKFFIWESRKEKRPPSLVEFLKFLYEEVRYEVDYLSSKFSNSQNILQDRWLEILDISDILNRYK